MEIVQLFHFLLLSNRKFWKSLQLLCWLLLYLICFCWSFVTITFPCCVYLFPCSLKSYVYILFTLYFSCHSAVDLSMGTVRFAFCFMSVWFCPLNFEIEFSNRFMRWCHFCRLFYQLVQSILIQSGKCKLSYVSYFVVVVSILIFNILFYYYVYVRLCIWVYMSNILFLLFV